VGTPLSTTAAVVKEAERLTREHEEVETVYAQIGADKRAETRSNEGEHTAILRIGMKPGGDLPSREAATMEELRGSLAKNSRLSIEMSRPYLFSYRTPVEVVCYAWDLDILRQTGELIANRLSVVPGLRDVHTSLVKGHPEIQIIYDRQRLHRLGLDPNTVASRVRDKIQGVVATSIHRGDDRIDLRVQLMEQDRESFEDLQRLNINPEHFPIIPLDAVAEFQEAIGPSEIRRVDQQRAVVVSANLEGFDLKTAASSIEDTLAELTLEDSVIVEVAGQFKEMEQSLDSLQFALLLATFLVYVIMASTFEHLIHPFVILFSIPLASVGTIGMLWISGSPLSVVVFIGVIVLAGVVVNNAIVLVDTINRLRASGKARVAAIEEACALRLRPILITTATTVLGLLPLSLGLGAGAEIQQPLAIAIIGGLSSSTLLTLGVIPALYKGMTLSSAESES
jgi:hydrophobic/amphiphilic exporter-1 (mainly G- bacteria), HAE1 family